MCSRVAPGLTMQARSACWPRTTVPARKAWPPRCTAWTRLRLRLLRSSPPAPRPPASRPPAGLAGTGSRRRQPVRAAIPGQGPPRLRPAGTRLLKVVPDQLAVTGQSELPHRHPDLQRPERPGLLDAVLAEPRLGLLARPQVIRHQAERLSRQPRFGQQDHSGIDWNVEPLMRIDRDAVGPADRGRRRHRSDRTAAPRARRRRRPRAARPGRHRLRLRRIPR